MPDKICTKFNFAKDPIVEKLKIAIRQLPSEFHNDGFENIDDLLEKLEQANWDVRSAMLLYKLKWEVIEWENSVEGDDRREMFNHNDYVHLQKLISTKNDLDAPLSSSEKIDRITELIAESGYAIDAKGNFKFESVINIATNIKRHHALNPDQIEP